MALLGISAEEAKRIADERISEYFQGKGADFIMEQLCKKYGTDDSKKALEAFTAEATSRLNGEIEAHKEESVATARGTIDERMREIVAGVDLAAIVNEMAKDVLSKMRPAVYIDRPNVETYELIKEASFSTETVRYYRQWEPEAARKQTKEYAEEDAIDIALKAGSLLGAQIMVVLGKESKIEKEDSSSRVGFDIEKSASARVNVAFYKRREQYGASQFVETR